SKGVRPAGRSARHHSQRRRSRVCCRRAARRNAEPEVAQEPLGSEFPEVSPIRLRSSHPLDHLGARTGCLAVRALCLLISSANPLRPCPRARRVAYRAIHVTWIRNPHLGPQEKSRLPDRCRLATALWRLLASDLSRKLAHPPESVARDSPPRRKRPGLGG